MDDRYIFHWKELPFDGAYYRTRAGRSRHGTGIRNTPPLKKGTSAD